MRINGILVFEHEADDLFVGLLHAESGQTADCVDRALDSVLYETVAAEKFISFVVHRQSHEARLNSHRDLGSAACLRSVADYARVDRNGIDDSMCDGFHSSALQIGYACSGSASRADSSAISRKSAYARLEVRRDEVGYAERAQA